MKKTGLSFWHPAALICTCGGVGKIPFAPGTWGSLVGLAYFVMQTAIYDTAQSVLGVGNSFALGLLDLLVWALVGLYCCKIYEAKSAEHDSSEIVIDEFVGQYLTCIIAIWGVAEFTSIQTNQYFALLTCFATFRLFDIVKRGPVGWIDRNVKGGMGVMLDDVVAGILAGLTTVLIFWLITII